MSSDSIFYRVQLTKKSLSKMFPDRKKIIYSSIEAKSHENDEDMVIEILDKF
jgi:hypothetical protein